MAEQESLQADNSSENNERIISMPQSSVASDKTMLDNVIETSIGETDTFVEMSETETEEDQEIPDKTSEDDSSEQTNTKKSRELKLLLALSKEANLDTNIPRKRKLVEGLKTKDHSLLKNTSSDSDIKTFKVATENKHNFKFPVTAESELEEELIENDPNVSSDSTNKLKRKRDNLGEANVGGATEDSKKTRKTFPTDVKMFKPGKDAFCWRCHRDGVNVACETCPRSYHQKCLKQTINNPDHWPCPECVAVLKAENTQTRSEAMKGMPLEHLCKLLKFAVNRMIQCQGSEPFLHEVNDVEFPDYKKYIIQPMDLSLLLKNIRENFYGSTQAFEADAKWLLHNSIIFNSYQSKLTNTAKNIIKVCKQEMAEIENCPNCYLNANTKRATWFVEACPKPHLLVWAKLKGFPYWPAKAMSVNSTGMVDVRFFGAHDRAWVHYKECFLYSEKDPNTFKQKRYDIEKCVEELNVYIENLRKAYGEFRYAPYRMPLDPENMAKQLYVFLPKYKHSKTRRKSSKYAIENVADEEQIKEEPVLEEEQVSVPGKPESSSEEKENKRADESPVKKLSVHKKDSTDSFSNVDSLANDNDVDLTMEGYGTDDDSVVGIDIERRRAFAGKNDQKLEEDEDYDNDTQVPSNISVESIFSRGNARVRGGLSNTPGQLKIARRISDIDNAKKRQSSEDVYPPHQKLSRRNSDQSVKSDSSRLSNISDKINRVDISENMEISLGNDDISCVSISENISPPNGESSRSSSDYSAENKRKPVQVDIDNAEFTISPSNKRKISDQLIKRLSDSSEKVEAVKKSLVETKSQTDILLEKFQGVVEREVVDFNQPSSSNNDYHNKSAKDVESNNVDMEKSSKIPTEIRSKTPVVSEKELTAGPSNSRQLSKDIDEKMDCEATNVVEKDLAASTSSEVIETKDEMCKMTNENLLEKDLAKKDTSNDTNKKQILIQPSITEFTNIIPSKNKASTADVALSPPDKISLNDVEKKKLELENATSEVVNVGDEFQSEQKTLDDVQIDKKKIFNIIHSSLNQEKAQRSEERSAKKSEDIGSKKIVAPGKSITKEVTAVDNLSEQNLQKIESMVGCLPKEISESDKRNQNSEVTSVEKETGSKSQLVTAQVRIKKVDKKQVIKISSSLMGTSKKRKMSSGDRSSPKPKVVKLVPIESILNKANEEKIESDNASVAKPAREKMIVPKAPVSSAKPSSTITSNISSVNSILDITQDEIKSEPESDNDSCETENLEAKRQYLSALNISEKPPDFDKNRVNEIRTRAKAEEKREKYKIVDNLTRVIDDVALNYSAGNDGGKTPASEPCKTPKEGEIFVKSFAKLPTPGGGKQRARKSFPTPVYATCGDKSKAHALRKEQTIFTPKKEVSRANVVLTKRDAPKAPSVSNLSASKPGTWTSFAKTHPTPSTANPTDTIPTAPKPSQIISNVTISDTRTTASVASTQAPISILQTTKPAETTAAIPTHFFLLPTSGLNYCVPLGNAAMNSIPPPPVNSTATTLQPQPVVQSLLRPSLVPLNLRASQNYIPQSDEPEVSAPSKSPSANNQLLNDLLSQPVPEQPATTVSAVVGSSASTVAASTETQQEDEFAVLNSILPDNVSRAVSDLLMRPPPKLRPRPPGLLNQVYDEGTPSSAGAVTARINSIGHRMGDYFRGMLIETLEDLGKSANPEAKVISLQLELETQKYRHVLEMTELRKNVCIILKDIQRSMLEEREKVIDETRAACEAEAIKRVELAKSKQWCANCSKEAQFYCCWNTSYCDYPCQQKHWPQHMGKCTQSIEKTNNTTSLPHRPSPQIVLRPTGPPKPGVGRIIAKPTKVYPRATAPIKTYKSLSTTNNHITVIETTPGSFELVGNGPLVSGKMFSSSPAIVNTKLKPINTTSNIPSTSYTVAPGGVGSSPRATPSTSTPLRTPPTRLP